MFFSCLGPLSTSTNNTLNASIDKHWLISVANKEVKLGWTFASAESTNRAGEFLGFA